MRGQCSKHSQPPRSCMRSVMNKGGERDMRIVGNDIRLPPPKILGRDDR